ncbi:MAG: hypothetical protein NTU69_12125 [Proteobacteria bacterium]|nr:hypothetical protein [Pseudomonadota bacterium]
MRLIQAPYRKTASAHYSDITLDIYEHLFNDANFSRQQVELLENMFQRSNDLTRERNSGGV